TATGAITSLDLATRKAGTGGSVPATPLPIALSPDGAFVAYADGSIANADGAVFAAAPAAGFAARAARMSDDGRVTAFVGLIGDVLVRDCTSLPCIDTTLEAPEPGMLATSLAVKPDGAGLAVNWTGNVSLYSDPAQPPRLVPLTAEQAKFGTAMSMDW